MKHTQNAPRSKYADLARQFAALQAENNRLAKENESLREELRRTRTKVASPIEIADALTTWTVNAERG